MDLRWRNKMDFSKMARVTAAIFSMVASFAFAMPSHAADLVVSAAASLTNAFTDIGHEFERAYPPTKVLFNFGGSGQLLQQIAKGAPVDVFASADQETMDEAHAMELIDPASRVDFVRNALVVAVPVASNKPPGSLHDLTAVRFRRIAIGNPESVPAGRYSKSALQAGQVWDALREKLINTQNVRQSLDYVARGEVDAAFVYRTDAPIRADQVKIAFEVPTATPIRYPIAVTLSAGNPAEARQFLAFLRSTPARRIFAQYGFQQP